MAMTKQEKEDILQLLLDLRKHTIQEFMRGSGIKGVSKKKLDLAKLIQAAINDGVTTYPKVLRHIDQHAPWGKQHVYLLKGPRGASKQWKDLKWVERHLSKHQKKTLLKRSKTLVLPKKLTLMSIEPTSTKLVITAVQSRRLRDRLHERDYAEAPDEHGQRVEFRAYMTRLTRLFVRFEWDLRSNAAMLQIGQLQRGDDYSEVRKRFSKLLEPWLALTGFSAVDLRKAIKSLQRSRQNGSKEIRVHSTGYVDEHGRRLAGHSAGAKTKLLGPGWVGDTMRQAARQGIGHHGNYYWASKDEFPGNKPNPLDKEVHVHLLASEERVNITRPHSEEVIRYVLDRIRAASA